MTINAIQYSVTRYLAGGWEHIVVGQCDTKPGHEYSYYERDSFLT